MRPNEKTPARLRAEVHKLRGKLAERKRIEESLRASEASFRSS